MLEYDFNELDNDFITIGSRYLLSDDKSKIGADLEKLAELGQINAIQSYYLFSATHGVTEMNDLIDKKLQESSNGKDFNYLLASANRMYAKNSEERQTLDDLIDIYNIENAEIKQIEEELDHLYLYFETQETKQKIQSFENKLAHAEAEHKLTENKILSTKFVVKQHEATCSCIAQANATKNPLAYERCFELLSNEIAGHFVDMKANFEKGIKIIRKELANIHKKDHSPQVDFALGKNLFFFSEKEKNKELGVKMLTKLAKRPLSKTLTEYQLQGGNTLGKITHNQKPATTIKER